MPTRRETELAIENERLREQLQAVMARGPAGNDQGIAGRVAITRLRDQDWPEFIAAVEAIPRVYAKSGYLAAIGYCRTVVRAQLDGIIFQAPRTADLVRAQHRMHAMLSPGEADVLMRSDRAGMQARIDFLEAAERHAFAPSIRSIFAKSTETPPGLLPTTNYSR